MTNLRKASAVLALAVLSIGAAYSQAVNGTLLGSVTDSSGAVVANAKVTITETNTNISHTAITNESGNYTFGDLPPGRYAVLVEQTGFKKENRRDIDLLVDSTVRVNVSLQPGSITETVEVTGAAPILQTDSAGTGVKMDLLQTATLPLISSNRNFQSLLNLIPGVAPVQEQHSQFFNASSSLQTEVNGQMREGNNFMIEGTDDNERTGLLQIYIPPVEAIQTVDISLTDHDPEMGRATGAVVNVLLKSGTNGFHGAAYEFVQNSDFNARSFFNPSVGHLAYNYVGGNLGGPIKKNKIFFFGDYLSVRDHEGNTNLVTIIPNQWRGGDLSTSSQIIYDPNTGNPLDGTGRTPFPGNVIPNNRINAVSAKILALFPATNQSYTLASPANNYFAALPYQKTTDSFDVKIDDNITEKDRLSGRFSYGKPVVFQAPLFGYIGGDGPGGAFMGTGIQKTYSTGLNYDHIFSPTLLAEARVGVSYYNNIAQNSDYGQNDTTAIGIPGVNINPFTTGFVGINLNDGISQPMTGYAAGLPWVRSEANVDIVNTWTKTLKNHSIKFGFDLKRIRDNLLQDQTYSPRGIISFGNEQTALCTPQGIGSNGLATSCATPKVGVGDDVAAYLLDVPYQLGRDINTYFPGLRAWEFFAFVGDKWQVSQKLTVDLGIRWEFYPPATPPFSNEFSNYDQNNNTLVVSGIGGNPTNLGMVTRYKNWAPRVGMAYRLDEKTVIRTGFGISYTPFSDNTYAYNYPVRANNFYTNVGDGFAGTLLPSGQPASFQNGFPLPVPVSIPSNGIINAGANSTLLSQSEYIINQNYKNPSVETWNIAIQRTLPLKLTLDVAYVGLHGVDTVYNYNMNNPSTLGGGTASEPLDVLFGKTASATVYWAGASSSYNALQVKLDRRSATFNLTTAFSWQRAMDYQQGDDGSPLWTFINFNRNYARADFDRQFAFVQSYVYSLPWGPGRTPLHGPINYLVGGWQLAGALTLESGSPIEDVSASGSSLNTPGEQQTADQVGPVSYPKGINVGNPWFSTSSFASPTGVRFGTSGRNPFSGPGLFILNASLVKNVKFRERVNIEIRGEAFNITNTPEFSNPNTSITSSTYGYVTGTLSSGTGVNGTGGGRALQLGTKITF
jgi:Carboxypeptidase regulatory-like domain